MPRRAPAPGPAAARALASALELPRGAALDAVQKAKDRVGVACSGGADSVALALWLYAHLKGRIALLHFNHGLRGEASDADEDFVRTLARHLKVPFHAGRANIPPMGARDEAALRALRFAFFETTARAEKIACLALAHHADDVVETMLLRLLRGSAFLAAPRAVHRLNGLVLARPFLSIRKAAVTETLRRLHIAWREDASNRSDDYWRNRLRQTAIPALEACAQGRDITAGCLRAHEFLAQDDEALRVWLGRLLGDDFPQKETLDFAPLMREPPALLRRALRAWLDARGGLVRLESDGFDALNAALVAGRAGRWSAGKDAFLASDGRCLWVEKSAPEPGAPWPERPLVKSLRLPTGARIAAQVVPLDKKLRARIFAGKIPPDGVVYLDAALAGELAVRNRRAGDAYRPLAAPGTRTLQNLFVDKKIPRGERARLPVVYHGKDGNILWIPGLPPSHENCLKPSARRALRLTYQGVSAKLSLT